MPVQCANTPLPLPTPAAPKDSICVSTAWSLAICLFGHPRLLPSYSRYAAVRTLASGSSQRNYHSLLVTAVSEAYR
jgi:hypothetical protein